MIFDDIQNWKTYYGTSKNFKELVKLLPQLGMATANGTYDLEQGCYYKVMSYKTEDRPKIIEAHRKEIDIQVLLSGQEAIKIFSREQVSIVQKYDSNIDCEFYEAIQGPELQLQLTPGKMAIFFPQDIHACQYNINGASETIKKVVFKVNEEFFTH
jgi:YhcH/YjgK/YiaL family protein